MEVTRTFLSGWHNQPEYVKGNKSYQYVSSAGLRLYFDSTGQPRHVSDDTPVTDLEVFITTTWQVEHYFNMTPTSMAAAISSYKSGPAGIGIVFEIVVDQQTNRKEKHFYWKSNKPDELRRSNSKELFTIDELLSGTWFICTDAY